MGAHDPSPRIATAPAAGKQATEPALTPDELARVEAFGATLRAGAPDLIRVITGFLARAGLSESEIQAALKEVQRDTRPPAAEAREALEERIGIRALSDGIRIWWNDSRFLDADGQPLPLPEDGGPPSLRTLLSLVVSDEQLPTALEQLKRSRSVERRRDGLWRPVTATTFVDGSDSFFRMLGLTRGLLDAIYTNMSTPSATNKGFERNAYSWEMAAAAVPKLRAQLRRELTRVSEDTHRTILNAELQPGEPYGKEFGVAFFVYELPFDSRTVTGSVPPNAIPKSR
jgi:hypothetical protein